VSKVVALKISTDFNEAELVGALGWRGGSATPRLAQDISALQEQF